MYTKGYNRLFWGMMIFIFHINLGHLNIFPNFVGYMFIYSGINILSSQHELYKKGKVPATLLVVLTLNDIWHDPNGNILNLQPYNLQIVTYLIATLTATINLYLIYTILKAIYTICIERELFDFASSVKTSWNFYLGLCLIFLFYTPFSINIPSNYNFFMIIIAISQMLMLFSIAFIFRRCNIELNT